MKNTNPFASVPTPGFQPSPVASAIVEIKVRSSTDKDIALQAQNDFCDLMNNVLPGAKIAGHTIICVISDDPPRTGDSLCVVNHWGHNFACYKKGEKEPFCAKDGDGVIRLFGFKLVLDKPCSQDMIGKTFSVNWRKYNNKTNAEARLCLCGVFGLPKPKNVEYEEVQEKR